MSLGHSYLELIDSQLPALQLLINMGWQYLTPAETLALRGGREGNVLLTGVLEPWLRQHNTIRFKGQRHAFSDGNISEAIRQLSGEALEGLMVTNGQIYELLTLGTSLPQTIDGDRKSFSLHYIDWQNPDSNVYHVADELPSRAGQPRTRAAPTSCCSSTASPWPSSSASGPTGAARREGHRARPSARCCATRRRTRSRTCSPSPSSCWPSAATTPPTPPPARKKFWSVWKEEPPIEATCSGSSTRRWPRARGQALQRRPLPQQLRQHFDAGGGDGRAPADRAGPHGLCPVRPERLLELAYRFIVFDDGVKKIARYQQYFGVQATIAAWRAATTRARARAASSGTPRAAASR